MNNRMSYNDVQQLKNMIRQRLAGELQNAMGGYPGMMNNQQRPMNQQMMNPQMMNPQMMNPQMPMGQPGRFAEANNRAARPMQQPMQPQQQMRQKPIQGQPAPAKPVNKQPVQHKSKVAPQRANNAASSLDKQIANNTAKPAVGAHFEKYDCGHPYPKMSVRKHLKEEMAKSRNERIDNLRYAYVMSEILSEPVCKRRRSTRSVM